MPLPFKSEDYVFKQPGLMDVLPIATTFFNATTPQQLTELPEFYGSGVYGLYYKGAFAPYAPLAALNKDGAVTAPIYIGMTKPAGGRTGILSLSKAKPLYNRLKQHRDSIVRAHEYALENGVEDYIKAEDFYCRFMIIPDEYWPLTGAFETGLISEHLPLWNRALSGFGIHNPGIGRAKGKVSEWDSLHPGRKHSNSESERHEQAVIFAKVQQYLAQQRREQPGLFS